MYTITIKHKETSASRTQRAGWIKNRFDLSAVESLKLVDRIIAGEEKSFNVWSASDAESWVECEYFTVTADRTPTEHELVQERWDKESDLLERGAAGDAEAAIEFCKLYSTVGISLGHAYA